MSGIHKKLTIRIRNFLATRVPLELTQNLSDIELLELLLDELELFGDIEHE